MDLNLASGSYKSGPMPLDVQFHLARKMAPAFWAYMVTAMAAGAAKEAIVTEMPADAVAAEALIAAGNKAAFNEMIFSAGPLIRIISEMPTEDADYVKNSCLQAWNRLSSTGIGYQPIYVPGSGLIFADITLPDLMQLIVGVLRENLGSFMSVLETLK